MSVKAITIEINGKDVSIPIKDAEKLYLELGELFSGLAKPSIPFIPSIKDMKPIKPDTELDKLIRGAETPCLWDRLSEEDKKRPLAISCPCPKCSPISYSGTDGRWMTDTKTVITS